jgi:hypothetical protein
MPMLIAGLLEAEAAERRLGVDSRNSLLQMGGLGWDVRPLPLWVDGTIETLPKAWRRRVYDFKYTVRIGRAAA